MKTAVTDEVIKRLESFLKENKNKRLTEFSKQQMKKIDMCVSLIKEGQNVILSGNPGTGKNHIAIALGIKACLDGRKLLFTTVPLFITQLNKLKLSIILMTFQSKLAKYDLVILD